MRKLLFILLVTNSVFSQDLKRNLKEFKSIIVSSAMDVELITSNVFKIEVTGKDVDKLNFENKNQELKLATSLSKKFKSDIKVKIYYQPGIRYMKFSNNVHVHSKYLIEENFLEFNCINNVTVDIRLKTVDFIARLELGSKITLDGITESQKIKVLTKSEFNGLKFHSKKSYIKVSAAVANIYVSEFLEANAKLKGKIFYSGEPFSVSEKSFLGGIIRNN